MPATWEGQSHVAVARQPSKLVPPPTLKERAFRSQTAPLQLSSSQPLVKPESTKTSKQRIRNDNDDRGYWQADDFDGNLSGLGIHNIPSHYELRRGKTEPIQATSGQHLQLSPPLGLHDPEAPPVQQPPPRNPRRLNPHDWRPASSVYVDDAVAHHDPYAAPSALRTPAKDMYRLAPALDISPPSSPELSAERHGKYPHDVSPIDDGPDPSHHELFYRARNTPSPRNVSMTNLTSMRHSKQTGHDQRLRGARSADRLRDPHADVVHPWETSPREGDFSHAGQPFGLTTTVTGPQAHRSGNAPSSLGQRMRKLTRGKTEPLESRPPWKGANGRAPLVEPMKDDLAVAPLSLQHKPSKLGSRSGGGQPETSSTAASTVRRLLPSRSNQKLKEAAKTPSPEPSSHGPAAHTYPTPPHNDFPLSQSHAPVSLPPPNFPNPDKAIRRKPSPLTHIPPPDSHKSMTSSVYSAYTDATVATFVPQLSTAKSSSPFTPDDPWVPPPSRFSVTTCNTTNADSPLPPTDEELPPLPPPPPKQPSVMDRRRPVPGGESAKSPTNEPIVISMKSSFGVGAKTGLGRALLDRSASIASTTKALPPSPMEKQSASDRVAYLNARLENLAHQRLNINRSIKQMTELMPTDSLISSTDVLRKREMEKKKVDGLKEELAGIQREEYDLGLKLFRAHKRLERESDFEGSALWIRRATEE